MNRRTALLTVLLAITTASCATAQPPVSVATGGVRHTAADVQFMRGMIAHHSQAIIMARMAPSHGASAQVALFCKKILISQRDEIESMGAWLTDRGERLPDLDDPHAGMDMSGGDHAMMPGMLSAEQMAQLEQARGSAFDVLFLTLMIRHHEGALVMVAKLFDTPGSGQAPEIFGYATDVDADQRAEIVRMQEMLSTIKGSTGT